MDILTQAVLGAATACAVAPAAQRRLAAAVGLFAGVLPDFDALISSDSDPLLVLDFHRHFTHALAFVPVGALLAALLLWVGVRKQLSFVRLYLYCFAGYALSGLLDACTSYGTHLWLPFSDQKVAWSLIAVVDPVFTLCLLIPLCLSLRQRGSRAVYWGFALAGLYLGMGYVQQQRAVDVMTQVAEARGHLPQQLMIKPTLGNLILWRSLYRHEGRIYVDAVRVGISMRHYSGQNRAIFFGGTPAQSNDLARFHHFADGWLVESRPGFVGDARYAMLPTEIAPIWGLRWGDAGQVEFVTERAMSGQMRRDWWAMLLGRELGGAP